MALDQAAAEAEQQRLQQLEQQIRNDIKGLRIKEFSGGSALEADEWLRAFREKTARMYITPERAARVLPQFLEGTASTWHAEELTPAVKDDYEMLCQAFRQKFILRGEQDLEDMRSEFLSTKLQAGEDVDTFVEQFKRKGLLLGLSTQDIRDQLWRSLDKELSIQLKLTPKPDTLDRMVQTIKAGRELLELRHQPKTLALATQPTNVAPILDLTEMVERHHIKDEEQPPTYRQSPRSHPRSGATAANRHTPSTLTCWTCNGQGHKSDICPNNWKSSRHPRGSGNFRRHRRPYRGNGRGTPRFPRPHQEN